MTVAVEEKEPPAEVGSAQVAKHRRKRDKKQSNAKRHAVIAGSVIAVVLAVAIGMHKASQVGNKTIRRTYIFINAQ